MTPTPFRIHVSDEVLQDLRDRLSRTRWTDAIAGSGFRHGFDLEVLRELTESWRERFDWRAQERRLNAFPQFLAEVKGVTLHFVHARGKGPRPLPLILMHGWPGTFAEFTKILPLLIDPAAHGGDPDDAFDVVVPSIPGYGFSARPAAAGMTSERIADLFAALMSELGYATFGAQGGDWGAAIATWLARRQPSRLEGLHLNYIPGSYRPPEGAGTPPLTAPERDFLESKARWIQEEGAYGHLQATRPQTLAVGLDDSPAALAAWIVEKFRDWSDCGGDVYRRFTREDLLTQTTIYWVTRTIGSSMRLYHESAKSPLAFSGGERIRVPTGVARFAKEAPMPPKEWVERVYDVRRWTEFPRGGHFAAMEEPEALAQDIRDFFRPLR